MTEAEEIIAKLDLKPLPHEGGFFVRRWQSEERLPNGRPAGTSIYFLLTLEGFSAFHRLSSTELWHFYAGCPVEHFQISPSGELQRSLLGPDILRGHMPQLIVPGECWQAARISIEERTALTASAWALLGCTMTPGWDERDFSLANRANMQQAFPAYAQLTESLTRGSEGII